MYRPNILPLFGLLSVLLVGGSLCTVAAQTRQFACEAAPATRRALLALPDLTDLRKPRAERLKPLLTLVEKQPRDLFIQRRYQDTFRYWLHAYEEFDRAFALYRRQPNAPVSRYLAARLTGSFNAQKAEQMFTELLAAEPSFPWAHLGIAELTDRAGARDAKKAELHLRQFLTACPASIEGYALLRTVEDVELMRSSAPKFRALLEARRDTLTMPYWRHLWDLELRVAAKEEQEIVRQRILKDVAAWQALPPLPTRDWYFLFSYAAQITKEQSIQNWLEETVLKHLPASPHLARAERARWAREHPRPPRTASAEEQRAYFMLERARLDELGQRFPDDADVLWDRWGQASSGGTSLPLAERLKWAEAYAELLRNSPDAGSIMPPMPIQLADLYVRWKVRLAEVPALVNAGLREAELQQKYRMDLSMFPAEVRKEVEARPPMTLVRWRVGLVLVDYYLHQRQFELARAAIEAGLAEITASDRDAVYRRNEFRVRQARLAVQQGATAQALTAFQQYLSGLPKSVFSSKLTPGNAIIDAVIEAKAFYLAQGGAEEKWLEWATSAPNTEPPKPAALEFTQPLVEFAAKDLNGKTWRLADLKGKATFIDVWATWCGPCRAQHPELQRLRELIKDRQDIQMLTFSVDEAAYLAEAYQKEHKYTFPVIVSKDLAEKLFPTMGLPAGWIIDAQGRRSTYFRFPGAEQAIAELERAAGITPR